MFLLYFTGWQILERYIWLIQCWLLQFGLSLLLISVTSSFIFLGNLFFVIYFSVLITLLQLLLSPHLPPLWFLPCLHYTSSIVSVLILPSSSKTQKKQKYKLVMHEILIEIQVRKRLNFLSVWVKLVREICNIYIKLIFSINNEMWKHLSLKNECLLTMWKRTHIKSI